MLYRPLSTSHGGKTSGGRVAVATAEAMDGVEEEESQVGVLGAVLVLMLMTPSASGTMLSNFFKGGSRRGHQRRLCESFYLRTDGAWTCASRSAGWVGICDILASDHMFIFLLSKFARVARIERSDAVISSSFHTRFFSSHFGRATHFVATHATIQ